MRRFLITIAIGLVLAFTFLLRIVFIVQSSSKPKADAQTTSSNSKRDKVKLNKVQKSIPDEEDQTHEMHILKTYFDNGVMSSEWPFKNGKLDGVVKQFYPNSKLLKETHYHQNVMAGSVKTYYENGAVWTSVEYWDGEPGGLLREYYASGAIWVEAAYEQGKIGSIHIYSENRDLGESKEVTQVADLSMSYGKGDNNGELVQSRAVTKVYYSNKSVSAQIEMRGDALDGDFKLFYPDGKLLKVLSFENNLLMHEMKVFYPNELLWIKADCVNGLISGVVTEYYPAGPLWIETSYAAGRPTGFPRAYSESGKIFQETHVKMKTS